MLTPRRTPLGVGSLAGEAGPAPAAGVVETSALVAVVESGAGASLGDNTADGAEAEELVEIAPKTEALGIGVVEEVGVSVRRIVSVDWPRVVVEASEVETMLFTIVVVVCLCFA